MKFMLLGGQTIRLAARGLRALLGHPDHVPRMLYLVVLGTVAPINLSRFLHTETYHCEADVDIGLWSNTLIWRRLGGLALQTGSRSITGN